MPSASSQASSQRGAGLDETLRRLHQKPQQPSSLSGGLGSDLGAHLALLPHVSLHALQSRMPGIYTCMHTYGPVAATQ